MEPSLTADPATLITWSLRNNRLTHFFTARLGLPQKQSSKNEKGRAIFEGDLALRSKALYASVLKLRRALVVRFGTKQRLRGIEESQRHILITEVTELLFAVHGPLIWSASPPFSTVIDVANYPKHLKHNNVSDRERLAMLELISCLHPDSEFLGSYSISTAGLLVNCPGANRKNQLVDAEPTNARLGYSTSPTAMTRMIAMTAMSTMTHRILTPSYLKRMIMLPTHLPAFLTNLLAHITSPWLRCYPRML
jgi:hypothetical protein